MAQALLEFTFHDCLGKGGFGEVYLATVQKAGGIARQMAVKVLKEGLDDEDDAVQRLRDEGRILGMLNHPAILGATDMCRINGRIALVMEYVEGMDITRTCKPDRLMPAKCVVQAIGEIADALHAAWSTLSPETGNPLHLIHRDVKPENMRVTTQGQVKLLDFGIARSGEMSRNAKTKMGELPFTPGYAAPECFRRGTQGAESDVYALGCSMYRMLVGERLYEDMEVGEQFATASLDDVYNPWLLERLALVHVEDKRIMSLLQRMLAYEMEERPTAEEVANLAEEITESLEGPSLSNWARSIQFPVTKPVKDAVLTGVHVFEDGQSPVEKSPGRGGRAPTPQVQKAPVTVDIATPAPTPSRAKAGGSNPDNTPSKGSAEKADPTPRRAGSPSRPPELPGLPGGKTVTPSPPPARAAARSATGAHRAVPVPAPPPAPAPASSRAGLFWGIGLVLTLGFGLLLVAVGIGLIAFMWT